eukprot:4415535-Pleurochrysis_carterae.AAC.2
MSSTTRQIGETTRRRSLGECFWLIDISNIRHLSSAAARAAASSALVLSSLHPTPSQEAARSTMAPASEEEHKQGKAKAPHASVAPGWLQPPTAASQFPMSRWTLRFKDASMETAHRETLTKSPTLISVFTICNAVCLCAYCTGYMIDCKIIQANFLPLIMLNIPYQAFELCCFLRPTVPGQASFCDYLERLKFVWAGVVFAGLHLCSYLLSNEREEACGGGALTASCSHIGLVFDGNVVICTVLIPYVTQPSFALKLCISATVMAIHTLSPFWFPIQIELPAIGISVA